MSEPARLAAVRNPGRTPPQNLDAERSVLGGILLDNAALDDVLAILKPIDFYREAHRKVFESMCSLWARTEPVDRVTVKAELTTAGAFDSCGGDEFIDLLDKIVPSASNLEWYAKIVAEKALLRRVIEAAHAIVSEGYEQEENAQEFANRAEGRMFDAAGTSTARGPGLVVVGSMVVALQKAIEINVSRETNLTGAPTGLDELDALTCGYQPGDLVIIAARPSMGKSALAMDAARAIARTPPPSGGTVAFFSLEMPRQQQMYRLAAAEARVDLAGLRKGVLNGRDYERLAVAFEHIAVLPLFIDDTARTLIEIRSHSRRLAAKVTSGPAPLRAVIVDYLGLMEDAHAQTDRERDDQAIGRVTKGLKALAKQLAVPVILLSQLNRSVEHRPSKRPMLSDLRESGNIEQDADLILFPYRGEVYQDDSCPAGFADIIIGKQRNGPTGHARVAFLKPHTTFCNADPHGRSQTSQLRFDGPPPHTDEDAP